LKVEALTDFLDRFSAGTGLWLDGREVVVERGRWTGQTVILKLRGVDDRNAAEPLRGKQLSVAGRRDLEDDTYYRHEIIGLTAIDLAGQPLGKITDIFETGSNDVYVVTGERGELLLPATEEVVVRVDIAAGSMVVDVIDGLEWERPPEERRRRVRRPGRLG
jgi:16S rRNA processing protein RimM